MRQVGELDNQDGGAQLWHMARLFGVAGPKSPDSGRSPGRDRDAIRTEHAGLAGSRSPTKHYN